MQQTIFAGQSQDYVAGKRLINYNARFFVLNCTCIAMLASTTASYKWLWTYG